MRCRLPWRDPRSARRPPSRARWVSHPGPRYRRPPRGSPPARRRSTAHRCDGWSGRPPDVGAWRCPRSLCGRGDGAAGAPFAWFSRPSGGTSLRCLAGLLPHVLVLVADPFALVGLGLADLPDVGGHLADLRLVVATNHDLGRRGDLELDPIRLLDEDGMGVPDLHLQIL